MNSNDLMENNPQTQPASGEAEPQGSTLKDKALAFKNTAQQWQRQATDSTRRAAKATDAYVHQQPWIIIAGVAVVCFAAGLLVGRRNG